ncbi:MAG TPA: universal stress protein [Acidobacteriaceae bacterium]|nr:universal stress protein [Acidobacteriaceae bacterium]
MRSAAANTTGPILVAWNPEENPLLVEYAAVLARRTGARVILTHVIAPNPAEKKTAPGVIRIADPTVCRAVREKVEFAALQLLWQGIVCDPVVLSGDATEQIAALARARGANRVLVSARKLSNDADSSEASVVERLLGKVDAPLLVLGPAASCLADAEPMDGRIVLALSLRHGRSAEFVSFGSRMARQRRSRLALLHVMNLAGMTEQQRQQAHLRARTHLAALAATEPDPLFPIEILVREGGIVESIVEEARCPLRDLIVIGTGTPRRGAAARNGVIHQVIASASCPVLVFNSQHDAETNLPEASSAMTDAAD